MAEGEISGNSFYERAVGFNNLNLFSFPELHQVGVARSMQISFQ